MNIIIIILITYNTPQCSNLVNGKGVKYRISMKIEMINNKQIQRIYILTFQKSSKKDQVNKVPTI